MNIDLSGSTIRFSLTCHNRGGRVLTEVHFPRIGCLTSAPGEGRRLWMYPRILQWADLYSTDVGLYFALEDPQLRSKPSY